MRISFLFLRAFSKTGGIEKFNKMLMLAIQNISIKNNFDYKFISAYDKDCDKKYAFTQKFVGFNTQRIPFTLFSINDARKRDFVILGHINLALIGVIIKIFSPSKKVILIAHGIEVWQKQTFLKKHILNFADKILVVSEFSKNLMIKNHQIPESKFVIFPNTFDPLFEWPKSFEKDQSLLKKYNLSPQNKILLTISRLDNNEKYKGYDKVIEAISEIVISNPDLVYIIIGKGDELELNRVNKIIQKYNLANNIKILGYISDNELINHYLMSDVFVMPSKREGFGIVFIEAALCGLQVIAGNKDASREALLNGEIGYLVDPDNISEIKNAILYTIKTPIDLLTKIKNIEKINTAFGFSSFESRLSEVLIS